MKLEEMYLTILELIRRGKVFDTDPGGTPRVHAMLSRYDLEFRDSDIVLIDFPRDYDAVAVIPYDSQLGRALCETFLSEPIGNTSNKQEVAIFLVASVTYDYEEAKTVIAARSDKDEAIRVARATPLPTSGTWLARHYTQVIALPLDGGIVPSGGEIVWSSEAL